VFLELKIKTNINTVPKTKHFQKPFLKPINFFLKTFFETKKFEKPILKPKPKPENVENHSQKPKPKPLKYETVSIPALKLTGCNECNVLI